MGHRGIGPERAGPLPGKRRLRDSAVCRRFFAVGCGSQFPFPAHRLLVPAPLALAVRCRNAGSSIRRSFAGLSRGF